MPSLDEVLERLRSDKDFRVHLEHDPRAALDGYDLTTDELTRLAAQVVADHHAEDPIARRTAQAGFFALFANPAGDSADDDGERPADAVDDVPPPEVPA